MALLFLFQPALVRTPLMNNTQGRTLWWFSVGLVAIVVGLGIVAWFW
jgi:hypothetical protein